MKRRTLLLGSAAALGGGLVVGLFARESHFEAQAAKALALPDAGLLAGWIRIAGSGEITVFIPHSDMGQGASTGLAMLVADELDADWQRVRVQQAPAEPAFANGVFAQAFILDGREIPALAQPLARAAFGEAARMANLQATGGSASIRMTGQAGMRTAGAAARAMLLDAAAAKWNVPADQLTARDSRVTHTASGRTAAFGELAQAAALLSPPRHPRLKERSQFRLIGRPLQRLDLPAKVRGETRYGIDIQLPGLLVATVKAAPVHGARLESVDPAPALQVRGVRQVVRLDHAVAVIADGYWPAQQGLAALKPVFAASPGDRIDSAAQSAQLRAALQGAGKTVHAAGSPPAVAGRTVAAAFEVPYLHHATMEPINVTARWAGGRLEVWGSEQDALGAKHNLVEISKLAADDVTFHPMSLGGGFGRRSAPKKDHLEQAWKLAQAVSPAPVKLIWSREEDFAQGAYRPAVATHIEARLGDDGLPVSWVQRFTDTPGLLNEGFPLPYPIAHQELVAVPFSSHVRVGAWRSVAHSQHGFFTECFVDELAQAAGRDPFEFRRAMLPAGSRHRHVLEEAARLGGWNSALPVGRGRGIALVESFGSIVCEVVEASFGPQGKPRVHRVVAVVDCGLLVNPDSGLQQVEGGIIMGLSAALGEAITVRNGAVVQRSFPDYPVLRQADVPAIEVHFVASDAAPGGLGEVGLPPAAPALANALAALTGVRIRSLPVAGASAPAGDLKKAV